MPRSASCGEWNGECRDGLQACQDEEEEDNADAGQDPASPVGPVATPTSVAEAIINVAVWAAIGALKDFHDGSHGRVLIR